jgi:hypothetical protein
MQYFIFAKEGKKKTRKKNIKLWWETKISLVSIIFLEQPDECSLDSFT